MPSSHVPTIDDHTRDSAHHRLIALVSSDAVFEPKTSASFMQPHLRMEYRMIPRSSLCIVQCFGSSCHEHGGCYSLS